MPIPASFKAKLKNLQLVGLSRAPLSLYLIIICATKAKCTECLNNNASNSVRRNKKNSQRERNFYWLS